MRLEKPLPPRFKSLGQRLSQKYNMSILLARRRKGEHDGIDHRLARGHFIGSSSHALGRRQHRRHEQP
jgi:hypothetical protein